MKELDHKNIEDFDHDPEDADEALSLSELPLKEDSELRSEEAQEMMSRPQSRRSSSEITTSELFEFFSDVSSDRIMCSAEDIIYCGKLVPFKEQHHSLDAGKTVAVEDKKRTSSVFRRRSESLSQIESSVTRSGSTNKTKLMMRNSRSLDYRKLHRPSMVSPDPEMERNSSAKSVGKSDLSAKKATKPRWCFLMFGIAKVPAEMDLSDMKSRQFRRNPSTLFPPVDNPSVNRSSSGGKASWRLLKALSCKDHASVAVTASLCAPQA